MAKPCSIVFHLQKWGEIEWKMAYFYLTGKTLYLLKQKGEDSAHNKFGVLVHHTVL
jgi:hypothetical protein